MPYAWILDHLTARSARFCVAVSRIEFVPLKHNPLVTKINKHLKLLDHFVLFPELLLEILNLLPVPLEKCLSIDNFLLLRVKLEDGLFNAYSVNVIRAVRT